MTGRRNLTGRLLDGDVQRLFARIDPGMVVAILLPLPALIPLLVNGLAPSSDSQIHLHRLVSFATQMRHGILWPRWTPYLHLGYGYPIHLFYAPGLYFLGGMLTLAGASPVIALVTLKALALILYAVGTYALARSFIPVRGALLAAAISTYAPFRLSEVWIQGNLAQLFALALVPCTLALMAKAARRGTPGWAAAVALTYAGVIVIHHPTAFLFSPFAGLYALLAPWASGRKKALYVTLGGLALGLVIGAIFWLPAVGELQYTRIDRASTGFAISEHFLSPGEPFALTPSLDRTAINPPRPNNLGLVGLLLAGFGLGAFWPGVWSKLSRWARMHIAGALLSLLGCTFLMLPASRWLWENVPLAQLILFPWRLLGLAVVWMALLAGAAWTWLPGGKHLKSVWFGLGLVLVLLEAANLMYPLRPFLTWPRVTPSTGIAFEAETGNLGIVSADEYLPRWVADIPQDAPPDSAQYDSRFWTIDVRQVTSEATVTPVANVRPSWNMWMVSTPKETIITLRQFYFPGFEARLDGAVWPVVPGANGMLTVQIPRGEHALELYYAGTPLQHTANALSIAGLVASLILIVGWRNKRIVADQVEAEHRTSWREMAALGALPIAAALIFHGIIGPLTGWFRPHSDIVAPRGMEQAVHARLGDDLELIGYTLSAAEAGPGETIIADVYWRALRPLEARYRTFAHVDNLRGTETWLNSTPFTPGTAPTDRWPTDQYMVDRHSLTVEPGTPPFVGTLRVGAFSDENGLLRDASGAGGVTLAQIRILGGMTKTPDSAALDVPYMLGDVIELAGFMVEEAGDARTLTLYWSALEPVGADYVIFMHWLDETGGMIETGDRPPLNGDYPTSLWLPGQIITDTFALPAGVDQVAVGLYDLTSGARLPVTHRGEPLPDGRIVLTFEERR